MVRRVMAEQILSAIDEVSVWQELIDCPDPRIRLDALKYLTDRRYGKASQSMKLETPTVQRIIIREDPPGKPLPLPIPEFDED